MSNDLRRKRQALDQIGNIITFVSNADKAMVVSDQIVEVSLSSTTSSTVTLPSVAEAGGFSYTIRLTSVGTGALTVQDLDGDAGLQDIVLAKAGAVVTLESNGFQWIVVAASDVAPSSIGEVFTFIDDFTAQALSEDGHSPWILNSGADAQALDPAINLQSGGVVRLTTGDADGTTANDGSQLVMAVPVLAQSGGLVFETRLHINTAITTVSVFAGLTDSTALEEAFSNSADVITSTATDGVGFLYDTDATTDEWWAVAVDSGTDDTGNATSGIAPVADTYQVLRIEVSADGGTIRFFIDGALVKTLTGGGVSPDVALYATIIACATTTTSKTVDVDYVMVSTNRV